MAKVQTRFGSLDHFEKGGIQPINDDARNYAFSNIFEVASKAEPWEKVAVGRNLKYVLETIRAAAKWAPSSPVAVTWRCCRRAPRTNSTRSARASSSCKPSKATSPSSAGRTSARSK